MAVITVTYCFSNLYISNFVMEACANLLSENGIDYNCVDCAVLFCMSLSDSSVYAIVRGNHVRSNNKYVNTTYFTFVVKFQ